MRPLFQNGIGPHRLSKVLRVLHTEKYDDIQLQYYMTLKELQSTMHSYFKTRDGTDSLGTKFSAFSDKNSYCGYVASANYLSYVYNSIINQIRPLIDQHISLLDGVVLKGDHFFKIIKHMGKINGVSTFSCLYTLVNEYDEIRLHK